VMVNKLRSKTIRQEVVQILRDRILKGDLSPGDRIVESEVAYQLGISRGPIREAVRQLEQEGLVVYNPHKGCSVTTLSADDAWEIYTLRAYLESISIRMCDGKIGEKYLKVMEDSIHEMEKVAKQDDLSLYVELDHLFHSQICMSAGKKRLYQLWTSLNSTSFAIFLTVHKTKVTSLDTLPIKHGQLLEIFKKGNMEDSCRAITDHYLSTGQKLYDYEKLFVSNKQG